VVLFFFFFFVFLLLENDSQTEDSEIAITSSIPITKLFIDEDFIIIGMSDGTMKLYDRELRTFLAQLNIIPVAARGLDPSSSPDAPAMVAPVYLQHKISFLARHDELVIAAMLDPSRNASESEARQLEVSIWPIRGQNVVQPLKAKLLSGAVNFMHYDEKNTALMVLTQYDGAGPDANIRHASQTSIANRGPLILLTWHPPVKSLMSSGIKWRETNDQQQAKLAQEVMEKVLLEPSFFRAMFMVEADQEEIDQIVESMFICLSGRDSLHITFIDTAVSQEIVLRRPSTSNGSSSVPNLSHSTPQDGIRETRPKKSVSMSMSTSSIPKEQHSVETRSISENDVASAAPTQYFPANSMTTAVVTKCLYEISHSYIHLVLAKPLTIMSKGEASSMIFSLPSTHATVEELPMFTTLCKVTALIVDGLIENQSKFSPALQRMLSSIHQAVCADNPGDSELRSFRRGAARVFLDYVLLNAWMDPVGAHLLPKIADEVRHNLRVVAQLLQVICGYSKHKLSDPSLCQLVTEYSTKWRSWLLSKVSESNSPDSPAAKLKQKDKDKRKNMARGSSFVAQRSGNNKTAALVVTKFIITHAQELLAVMTKGTGRTPDPTATKIRAISDSLLMPIMSLMAKKGTKNVQLAASLRVFGRSGSMPSSGGSGSSHTNSSSESVSSESIGPDQREDSGGSEWTSRDVSPTPKRNRKSSSSPALDSGSSEGRTSSNTPAAATTPAAGSIASDSLGSDLRSSDGSAPVLSRKSSQSPRKPKRAKGIIKKKISSGSLTSSTVEEEKDEDIDEDLNLPPRAQSADKIRIVGEYIDAVQPRTLASLAESSAELSSSGGLSQSTTPVARKRKPKTPATPATPPSLQDPQLV
jgi:hypothetical protein